MSTAHDDEPSGMRVAKWLAHAGVASRRASEVLVRERRVEVDGVVVTDLATKIPPDAEVKVDGSRIRTERMAYFMLNKPKGVVCTNTPLELRPRAIDLVTSTERVYPVGRLDEDSEGLLLLTNDGELAHRLTHPSFEIPKTYLVKVHGRVEKDALARIRDGVYLAEGRTAPVEIYVKRRGVNLTTLEMVLREGINREIRRMLAKVEHPVISLRRVTFGPLELSKLPLGGHRRLSPREVDALHKAARGGYSGPKKPVKAERTGATPVAGDAGSPPPQRARSGPRHTDAKPRLGGGPPPRDRSARGGKPRRDDRGERKPRRGGGPPARPRRERKGR